MRNALAIMQRELSSLFYSPIGYIVLAGFLVLTGVMVLVTDSFGPGRPATLRSVFDFTPYILTIVIPAICMRSISEEYRAGTIESLMTAPVSDTSLVVGKFLAAFLFYGVMLAGTLIYLIMMMIFGNPDLGASASSYIGLLLAGAAFTAVGVFTSSLTRNQIVAWIAAAVPLMLFVWFSTFMVRVLDGPWRQVFQQFNVSRHLSQFSQGLLTAEGIVMFLATTLLFLFLTVRVVESRRWR